MYHCHLRFYLTGCPCSVFESIKEILPFEHFAHEFFESVELETEQACGADVILLNLMGREVQKRLPTLLEAKKKETDLIVLADKSQIPELEEYLEAVRDIWVMPMTDAEARFRFQKWQQTYKMEKDYGQTSQFFEATINNVPNLIWYKDKNGIHEKVNDSFCRTVGKTKTQVEGRGHAYIWDVEQDDPACIESEQEVMTKRRTFVSEEVIKTGEGMRTLTTYKSPLYDIDGSVMGTVGVAIDVTQERAYEQEIVQKNRTLETLFTTIDCGVICHSLDGSRILSINRAALKILGYETKEELLQDGFDLIASSVLEEDREALQENIEDLKKEGDSVSVEYRIRHKNGDILHIMGNVKLIRENGQLFYQRFLLDCTAQKLQEKQNERRQMELVKALSTDYNIVCFFDLDSGMGRLLQNDRSEDMFDGIFEGDISLVESMGKYIRNFVHEEDRETVREASSPARIRQELEEKLQYYVNYRACRKDGIRYFQVKAVRAGAWEENHGIVLGFRSVDDEIRNEMEQKRLLEDALMQANRASKAKSVFLSNMSHDIRTPMNAIVGFTSLAMKHIDNRERMEEYLKKIMTSGNHLLSLINDVLDMSRIESGKIRLDEKACSLPEILHSICNIVQADVHAKQLELHIDTLDIRNEDIYCDKLRLNQVLLNLLGNAVKYTGAGGAINMRITEKAGAPDGFAQYEFSIKDNGVGMTPEFVERIFEPFSRAEDSRISKVEGAGLGMTIAQNIIKMMNGDICIDSQVGSGTQISVTVFLKQQSTKVADLERYAGLRVLVVDDDRYICEVVCGVLEEMKIVGKWTQRGRDAVRLVREAEDAGEGYFAVILDWQMPDMDGIETAKAIRREAGERIKVIMLSGYDWSEVESEVRDAGVDGFLSKPLLKSRLVYLLKKIAIEDKMEEKAEGPGEGEDAMPSFHGKRILLTEDNELNREIAMEIIGSTGAIVECAEDGKQGVEKFLEKEEGYYDLIFMDIQMPVMNGHEATEAIRKLDRKDAARIPIIALTANAYTEDVIASRKAGMNEHMTKPLMIEKLMECMKRWLK